MQGNNNDWIEVDSPVDSNGRSFTGKDSAIIPANGNHSCFTNGGSVFPPQHLPVKTPASPALIKMGLIERWIYKKLFDGSIEKKQIF